MKTFNIRCLDTGVTYLYLAETAYEAMTKHIYFLNLVEKQEVKINKTESGLHLYIEHSGKCYGVAI